MPSLASRIKYSKGGLEPAPVGAPVTPPGGGPETTSVSPPGNLAPRRGVIPTDPSYDFYSDRFYPPTPIFERAWPTTGTAGPMQPGQINQNASNVVQGVISIIKKKSGSFSFAVPFLKPPVPTITPLADPTSVGVYWTNVTTKSIQINLKTAGTIEFAFHCVGVIKP